MGVWERVAEGWGRRGLDSPKVSSAFCAVSVDDPDPIGLVGCRVRQEVRHMCACALGGGGTVGLRDNERGSDQNQVSCRSRSKRLAANNPSARTNDPAIPMLLLHVEKIIYTFTSFIQKSVRNELAQFLVCASARPNDGKESGGWLFGL